MGFDYLVIGHVTRDRKPDGGFVLGGTVTYAARTARALGCRAGVVTSAETDLPLSEALGNVEIHCIPSPATTTFENRYTSRRRIQIVGSVAPRLTPEEVPPAWRGAAVVHLGPVAGECDPALVEIFPGSFLGVTPQGWMRRWDQEGRVGPAPWDGAEAVLARADAVVLSQEDVAGDEAQVARWARLTPLLVLTRGPAGCTLFVDGRAEDVPATPIPEVDPTGAGDIFAAAFFVLIQRGWSPLEAARFANCVAAASVTRPGLAGTPTPDDVARCLASCADAAAGGPWR